MTYIFAEIIAYWFIFVPLFLVYLLIEVENDSPLRGTFVLLLILGLFQVFSDTKPLNYIWNYPVQSIMLAISYFVVGAIYVFIKWYSFVYFVIRSKKENSSTVWKYSLPLKVSDYKEKIYGWMIYWPLSGVWTLLNDPVRRIVETIYNSISGSLQSISDKAFSDYEKEILSNKSSKE